MNKAYQVPVRISSDWGSVLLESNEGRYLMMEFLESLDWSPLIISLKTGVVATIVSFFLGLFAARKVIKLSYKAKAVVDGILTLPMVLPPTVAGFILLLIFSRRRPIGIFLDQQLDIQRQKEQILATVVKDAHKTSGEDSGLTRQAETNLLKQQKAIAQMEAEMRRLNIQIKAAGGNATTFGQRMSASIGQAKAGLGSLSSGFNLLSAKMAAVLAIATTGAGLFNITQSAMESGESLDKLTQRLHTSSAEAAKLNRVFAMVGLNV